MSSDANVIIIGAGLAGLSCANRLVAGGKSVLVLEATDRVGGRVRTDIVGGFALDHGFQVLLTGYPACKEMLDYDALDLKSFEPGALIRQQGELKLLGDPWRRPTQAFATLINPVGSIADKLRIAKLKSMSRSGSLDDLYQRNEKTTEDRLVELGFSTKVIDQFFRPFLGGVFLDESLSVSSRMLEFVFRMFAAGDIAVPAKGMAEIPKQLAAKLPERSLRLRTTVASIDGQAVHLTDGTSLKGDCVVVATESSGAAKLLGQESLDTEWRQTTTVYFAANQSPDPRKLLMLRGDEDGPVQTAVVMSDISADYAPSGQSLVSVNVSEGVATEDLDNLDADLRRELIAWFGDAVKNWRRLGVYRIPYGLPYMSDPIMAPVSGADLGVDENVFVCGDHRETPSIQGAMNSGMRVAELIKTRQLT